MFCYQCEQTAKGTGCTLRGVCGKDPQAAALQDLLIHSVKGISMFAHRSAQLGEHDREIDVFVIKALFATVTNVNFDPEALYGYLAKANQLAEKAKASYENACKKAGKTPESLCRPSECKLPASIEAAVEQGQKIGIEQRKKSLGDDVTGLQELILYGLKGAAAYADHAQVLGKEDPAVYASFHEILDFLAQNPTDINALLGKALQVGEHNLKCMELLDAANTGAYGHPTPTQVRIEPIKGKAIVVSGHDLKDLEELLKQTEGRGINVYTHGEMLPAHGYPGLKKYKHLVGNYGGAWQEQQKEFSAFPGAILMTTNCIIKPRDDYKGRIFTRSVVGWPGVKHVTGFDFSPVIKAALDAEGFKADGANKTILVGFGRNAVLSVAGAVIDAVKAGKIRHFFLVGGCDGARPGRNYYTDFAQAVPKDCVILTLACGKYRFNRLDFGTIGGIPRLLDIGQCNDAYSAIQIAGALAKAFNTDVNSLPLSIICSWFEQKAVAILLTLLHLGIRNIRLGPSLPAFVTPAALNVLVQKFNLAPISTPQDDLRAILGS
jgi:hydroxylamine reductase